MTAAELLDLPLERHPAAAVRAEPFGALAYHHATRRLLFIKNTRLSELVTDLGDYENVRAALVAHGIGEAAQADFVRALQRLIDSEVVRVRVG